MSLSTTMQPDRISNLPDSILCHILSFIPTKHAAATSILSTSWKSIWLSALTLDFKDKTFFKDFNSFQNAVDTSISSRKTTLPILSFRFKCSKNNSPNCHPKIINGFVYIATQRKIENLNINIATNFPPSILTCKTLKVLKLKRLKVEDFSHQVDLPLLKSLHLSKVYFQHHEYLVKLLSCCPNLEDLQLKYLIIPDYLVAREKFKALPNLIKARVSYYHDSISFTLVCNVKSLHVEFKPWTCCTKPPMFHNLTNMELKFDCEDWPNRWNWLLELLECCPKLQHFNFEDHVHGDELCDKNWKEPLNVPKCVSSELRTCCIGGYKGGEFELKFAKYIMQNSKVLHTMTIKCTSSVDMNDMREIFMESFSSASDSTKCEVLFVQ